MSLYGVLYCVGGILDFFRSDKIGKCLKKLTRVDKKIRAYSPYFLL